MTEIGDEKAKLRAAMTARRREAGAAWREAASRKIASNAAPLVALDAARCVSVFVSRGSEADTSELIDRLLKAKKRLAIPRVAGEHDLDLHEVDDFPVGFAAGSFGILEPDPQVYPHRVDPADLDVIFVPGLAFDRRGYRLGYGRGFYDKLLLAAPKALKIGLGFSFQVAKAIPEEPHDIQLDLLVTDEETIDFRS